MQVVLRNNTDAPDQYVSLGEFPFFIIAFRDPVRKGTVVNNSRGIVTTLELPWLESRLGIKHVLL